MAEKDKSEEINDQIINGKKRGFDEETLDLGNFFFMWVRSEAFNAINNGKPYWMVKKVLPA